MNNYLSTVDESGKFKGGKERKGPRGSKAKEEVEHKEKGAFMEYWKRYTF